MPAKWTKSLLLLLLLGMPVALYLFLQGFGENQYTIPIFYENGVEHPLPGCGNHNGLHFADTYISKTACDLWRCKASEKKLKLFSFALEDCPTNQMEEFARVSNIFRDQDMLQSVTLSLSPEVESAAIYDQMHLYGELPMWSWWSFHPDAKEFVRCGLRLEVDCTITEQLVLLDSQYRVRGYYQIANTQDLDRLVTEIQILLIEQENKGNE